MLYSFVAFCPGSDFSRGILSGTRAMMIVSEILKQVVLTL